MFSAYLGKQYSDEEILNIIRENYKGKWYVSDNISLEVAKLLSKNKIIGWFQGRSEFGPRALGHRSIFTSPIDKNMKDILNERVKFRENFRPFAPIFLLDKIEQWCGEKISSPYMLFVQEILPDYRDIIPAVVHVDNTARVQTITREQSKHVHDLIIEFEKITKIPVILNTSFNIKGEPIVETPLDALNCFIKTDIDVLVLGKNILIK